MTDLSFIANACSYFDAENKRLQAAFEAELDPDERRQIEIARNEAALRLDAALMTRTALEGVMRSIIASIELEISRMYGRQPN
ncbi:MAG: hypothetical protein SH859_17190 [Hyphomicrobium aestuarii]|nr:hypothetical protein [Hyphomicrobium aestuarii]